jgi:hypothetical protein
MWEASSQIFSLLAASRDWPSNPPVAAGLVCVALGILLAVSKPRRHLKDTPREYEAKLVYCRIAGGAMAALGAAMALSAMGFARM